MVSGTGCVRVESPSECGYNAAGSDAVEVSTEYECH